MKCKAKHRRNTDETQTNIDETNKRKERTNETIFHPAASFRQESHHSLQMEEVKKGSKYSPFNGAQKMKIPKMDIPGLLKRLVDPSEPWVITPNGSMFGYFDFVS